MPILSGYSIAESIKNLLSEKVFSAYVPTWFIPFAATSNKNQIVLLTDKSEPGRNYLSNEVALGICKNCNDPESVKEFPDSLFC